MAARTGSPSCGVASPADVPTSDRSALSVATSSSAGSRKRRSASAALTASPTSTAMHRTRGAPVGHVDAARRAARIAPRSADSEWRDRCPTTPRRPRAAAPRRAWQTRGRVPARRGWRPSPCPTSRCRAPRRARRRAPPPRAAASLVRPGARYTSGRRAARTRSAAEAMAASIGARTRVDGRLGGQRAVAKPRGAQVAGPGRLDDAAVTHGDADVVAGAAAPEAGDVGSRKRGGRAGRHGAHYLP